MTNITITYQSSKNNEYNNFRPCVYVNGKYHYHTEHAKKTQRGALKVARELAERIARYYNAQNVVKQVYNVVVKEI